MTVALIIGTSGKGNTYYQLRVQCNRFYKYIFISDIEAAYILAQEPNIEQIRQEPKAK